jgi:hypothetical protein
LLLQVIASPPEKIRLNVGALPLDLFKPPRQLFLAALHDVADDFEPEDPRFNLAGQSRFEKVTPDVNANSAGGR